MKTKKPKIEPLTVWIIADPNSKIIALNGDLTEPLCVFRDEESALSRRRLTRTTFEVMKATLTRDNSDTDYNGKAIEDANEISRLRDELKASYAANRVIEDVLIKAENERAAATGRLTSLETQIHEGKIWNKENPRWTPRVQQVLELAEKEAEARNATYVGTESLLLAMLKQEEGVASHHFRAIGLSYDNVSYALKVSRCS